MSQTPRHEFLSLKHEWIRRGRDDKSPNPPPTRIRELLVIESVRQSNKHRTTNERLSQCQSQPLLGCLSFSLERKEGEEEVVEVEVEVGDGD